MENQRTARAIIEVEENGNKKIVSMKRTKYKEGKIDKIYYTFPGGHVENDETYEETVVREIKEELNIEIYIKKELTHFFNTDLNRQESFFVCEYISGKIERGDGPEWSNPDKEKYGEYEIVLIDVDKLEQYNLLPLEIREMLIKRYK
ncbi:MAG: NUDIX domain-containing protein [Clostridia bacterium]|nr:NUDIX domain-containing protein [Clostridia bacterium]